MDQAPLCDRPVAHNVPDLLADGLLDAYVRRPWARAVARWAGRRGLTPDAFTATSAALALLAAVWFSAGTRGGLIAGSLLLAASLAVGVRTVAVLDAAKELAVYVGLAAGGAANGENLWWAATAAVALLSVRITMDAAYGQGRPETTRWPVLNSLRLPFAERFTLIAVTAAFAGARQTFDLLVAWQAAALAVTVVVRVGSSLARPAVPRGEAAMMRDGAVVRAYRDDGPANLVLGLAARGRLAPLPAAVLAAALTGALLTSEPTGGPVPALFAPVIVLLLTGPGATHPHTGRLDWLVPPITRGIEYGYLAVLGFAQAVPAPLVHVLIAVLALHHCDTVHRVRQGRPPQAWVLRAGLGWEGRSLFAALAGLSGPPGGADGPLPFAYAALAAYLGVLFGGEGVVRWARSRRRTGLGVMVDLEEKRA